MPDFLSLASSIFPAINCNCIVCFSKHSDYCWMKDSDNATIEIGTPPRFTSASYRRVPRYRHGYDDLPGPFWICLTRTRYSGIADSFHPTNGSFRVGRAISKRKFRQHRLFWARAGARGTRHASPIVSKTWSSRRKAYGRLPGEGKYDWGGKTESEYGGIKYSILVRMIA